MAGSLDSRLKKLRLRVVTPAYKEAEENYRREAAILDAMAALLGTGAYPMPIKDQPPEVNEALMMVAVPQGLRACGLSDAEVAELTPEYLEGWLEAE